MTLKTPPLADGLPLVGSVIPMARDLEGFIFQQYAKHGSCFRVKVLNQEFLVFGGPDAAQALAQNEGEVDAWQVWAPIIEEFGGRQTLGMLEGEKHRRYRAAARQGFAKTRVQQNVPLLISLTREALDAVPAGKAFEVGPWVQELVASSVGMLTLGRKPGDSLQDFIKYWHTHMAVTLSGTRPKSDLTKPAYLKAKANARAAAQQILDMDDSAMPSPYARDLKKFMQEDPELLNEEELLFMMLLPYVAGLDTVVNVLTLSLYHLYSRPELLRRLQDEVRPVLAAGLPAERLRELKLLHALVLEVMRFHPIANMVSRHATKDFEFQGYNIKAGQKILMALMASQRDPAFFRDPEKFDVERFMEPRNEHKQKGAMNPYGAGAHTCLGAGMAETLLAVLLATIVGSERLSLFPLDYQIKPFHINNLAPDPHFRLIKL